MGLEKIRNRESGLLLYGFTPPKLDTEPGRLSELARRRVERLERLPLDGCVVYDVQDESSRNANERPFPFSPTFPSVDYARGYLDGLRLGTVLYVPAASHDEASLDALLRGLPAGQALVLVGSPSKASAGLSLDEAYALVSRSASGPLLGGVSIPERHARSGDEHERLARKAAKGCSYFISQCVYDVGLLKDFLSDYRYACLDGGREPAYQVFTLTVCGSARTLDFMDWLGISVPRWLKADLARSGDIIGESLDACQEIAAEVAGFCGPRGIPFGFNVESVSNRKEEIEASVELTRRVADILSRHRPSGGAPAGAAR